VDIEARHRLHAVPVQQRLWTVRDERVRVNARDHDAVDDGWLYDKAAYAFIRPSMTRPLCATGACRRAPTTAGGGGALKGGRQGGGWRAAATDEEAHFSGA
jgi:hypothetical protein